MLPSRKKLTFLEKNTGGIRAPHFAMYVKDYLDSKYGEDVVDQGGLKVITTLDYSIQQKAENVVKRFAPTLESQFNASNTAMVAVNPKNGDILMMVGSRDYFDKKIDGNFNVTTALRQPGSTFKPFVYATAFMKGYTPDTVLFDVPTEFSSECNPDHTPKDGVDPQEMLFASRIRQCLSWSNVYS
jgi:membrane peptidoglycan carboxypeptidase